MSVVEGLYFYARIVCLLLKLILMSIWYRVAFFIGITKKNQKPRMSIAPNQKMMEEIMFSQKWEDTGVLRKGLRIKQGDRVLSIAAAGDNALALLLDDPSEVVAIDFSPSQIALCSLKIQGIKHLTYQEFKHLLGFGDHDANSRLEVYNKIRKFLSNKTQTFWDGHLCLIGSGIIHCGSIDKMLHHLSQYILPIGISKNKIKAILESTSISKQREHYEKDWKGVLFKIVFRVYVEIALGLQCLKQKILLQSNPISLYPHLQNRLKHVLCDVPIQDNFYLEYMLTGNISGKCGLPVYLQPENYCVIRDRIDRLTLVEGDILTYCEQINEHEAVRRFDTFNLSDIFTWLSDDMSVKIFNAVIAAGKPNSRLCYWNLVNKHEGHVYLPEQLVFDRELSEQLFEKDRVFLFRDYVVNIIV